MQICVPTHENLPGERPHFSCCSWVAFRGASRPLSLWGTETLRLFPPAGPCRHTCWEHCTHPRVSTSHAQLCRTKGRAASRPSVPLPQGHSRDQPRTARGSAASLSTWMESHVVPGQDRPTLQTRSSWALLSAWALCKPNKTQEKPSMTFKNTTFQDETSRWFQHEQFSALSARCTANTAAVCFRTPSSPRKEPRAPVSSCSPPPPRTPGALPPHSLHSACCPSGQPPPSSSHGRRREGVCCCGAGSQFRAQRCHHPSACPFPSVFLNS